jgi:hypothetical protein
MRRYTLATGLLLSLLAAPPSTPAQQARSDRGGSGTATDLSAAKPGRDPKQPIDEAYTKKIREYTTEPFFLSPLVDYLPASKTVPTPMAVLGDIAGSPTKLPYSSEVYEYMRMLAKATPRVRVYSIGRTEEGREMIAVAVASDSLMASLDRNKANLAQLADPRTISMDDARAERIIGSTTPVYYITGTIHSPESGAPTALIELAYRLAVDDSPYLRNIRDHLITLITPIVEVDGRDREVDIVKWHFAHPNETFPNLIYWGHYVGHDNNRDAMGLTLKLSQNVLNTYLDWDAQVLHDLHESVPFLYDNTIGDGPYNAWIDPLLANEWRMIGWNNVQEMMRFGMPGVFAHGDFDTWSPGYLMFMAAMHNGISRLYETFGNGGTPETMERTLSADETSRTWYRQDPPLPRVKWSIRNNNNYEETGLLVSLNYFANNRRQFLENFYEKSKRSILKARTEGPAAYVFSAGDPRLGPQAELLRVLQKQHVEISRATKAFTVQVPASRTRAEHGANARGDTGSAAVASAAAPAAPAAKTVARTFPAGSYIVRMDQPYSRIADALLDYQYWSPDDPQKQPYDDTGWTFPELFAVQSVRVTDQKVLDVPMTRMTDSVRAAGGISGQGQVFAIDQNGDNSLATLRYQLASADMQVSEQPFQAAEHNFARGSFVISGVSAATLGAAAKALGLQAIALPAAPQVAMHPARAARVAILHTWTGTQTEGWWRLAFDVMRIPYTYISVQDIARTADLNALYDVILFPPAGGSTKSIVDGLPMWRNPMPWKHTPETPNIGTWAQTDDIRPGMGFEGLANLQRFVARGGVLVGVTNTAGFAVTYGFTNGVTTGEAPRGHVVGSILRTRVVDGASPIMYGVRDSLAVYSESGESFTVSNTTFGRGGRGREADEGRPTGRGTANDPDVVQGRAPLAPENEAPAEPEVKPWESAPITDEQLRNPLNVIPPDQRPRVVLRFSGANDLLVSGLLDGGKGVAEHAVVVDVPVDKGHVVLFGNNPVYRGETIGSYTLVLNTLLNFDHLNAGRKLDAR